MQLGTGKPDDEAVTDFKELYISVLGAVAYLEQTNMNVLVLISALQRQPQATSYPHTSCKDGTKEPKDACSRI